MKIKKKIFISPLSWGLGHATRIIPIIQELENQNIEIYIGANNSITNFLLNENLSKKITFLHIPDYQIRYAKRNALLKLFIQLPLFIISTIIERIYLIHYSKNYKFDFIISDNRYGIRLNRTKSIIITHQTNLIIPKSL